MRTSTAIWVSTRERWATSAPCGSPVASRQRTLLNRETRPDALEQLAFKTGWVLLGILDEDGRVDAADGSTPGHLPDVGARMRLCRNSALYIVAYATDGEARRMEAPTDATRDSRTRLAVAAGTLVHVDEIHVSEETERSGRESRPLLTRISRLWSSSRYDTHPGA